MPWRTRSVENVAREFKQAHKMFPQAKEFFFDDDTFNIRKDRVIALCKEFKPVGFRWSCTSRVHGDYETLKAMADAGCRLLIVGFESGDAQILKNIKKGQTLEMGRNFVKNCKKVGIHVHGDFIIGLPGETKETIEKTINFAKELDCETIQVSMAHAYPGTELYDKGTREGFLAGEAITDDGGHQLPHLQYPGLSKEYMVEAVNRFYDSYYFRPRVAWRIVRDALWDGARAQAPLPRSRGFPEASRGSREGGAQGQGRRQEGHGCRAADEPAAGRGSDRRVAERMTSSQGLHFKTFVLILIMVSVAPLGDTFLRQGHEAHRRRCRVGRPPNFSIFSSRAFTSGTIWIGIGLLLTFFIAYLLVLSWADYSYVLPASSISTLVVALARSFCAA